RLISRSIPSSFGCEASRTSMTYLKASGKASGRVNFPIPASAAPTTSRRCGLTNERNLGSGERTELTSFESMKVNLPSRRAGFSKRDWRFRKQWICLWVVSRYVMKFLLRFGILTTVSIRDRRALTDIESRPSRALEGERFFADAQGAKPERNCSP